MPHEKWKPRLGRWKTNWKKRRTFIRRALAQTRKTMAEIDQRAVMPMGATSELNFRDEIRTPEQTKKITAEHRSKNIIKISAFTPEQKWQFIDEHLTGIKFIANKWHSNPVIKKQYPDYKSFLTDLKNNAFMQLDYYDQQFKGKLTGKPKTVGNFIITSAHLFCIALYSKEIRALEKKDAVRQKLAKKPSKRQIKKQERGIPLSTRTFLKRIYLDLPTVAQAGFENVKIQLTEIITDQATGLTQREQQIALQRLEGYTGVTIGGSIDRVRHLTTINTKALTRQAISLLEKRVVKKIAARLEQMRKQRSSS